MGVHSGLAELTAMLQCRRMVPSQIGGSFMEAKAQKQPPRAFYLGLVVVFAVLILAAFLRATGKF